MSDTPNTTLSPKALWITISSTGIAVSLVWGFFFTQTMSLKNEQITLLKQKAPYESLSARTELIPRDTQQSTIKALRIISGIKGTIQVQSGNALAEQLALQFRSIFEDANWNVSYEKSQPVNSFANFLITIPESNPEIESIMQRIISDLGYPDALKTTNVKVVNILIGQGFK